MIPKIKKMEFQNAHVNDEVYREHDLFLHQSGLEAVEPSNKLTMEDFEKMLLHEPQAMIFGTGFKNKSKVDKSILEAAKKNNIEVYMLPTDEAARKFQELARTKKKVVAKLHIHC